MKKTVKVIRRKFIERFDDTEVIELGTFGHQSYQGANEHLYEMYRFDKGMSEAYMRNHEDKILNHDCNYLYGNSYTVKVNNVTIVGYIEGADDKAEELFGSAE